MAHTHPPSVLIVDDDPGVRLVLRRVVEREGYAPLEAGSGSEGLAIVTASADDLALVLLDLRMPGMNGFEFRARQAAIPAAWHIPTIVLTGQPVSPEELERLRPEACLSKPTTVRQLESAIRICARYRPCASQRLETVAC
ncbi:MAG: response regulator [Acidimicrobiia bacterium]|nr:response regulator [Acidimicrobiia bacterium]